jgi:hypothetical protein
VESARYANSNPDPPYSPAGAALGAEKTRARDEVASGAVVIYNDEMERGRTQSATWFSARFKLRRPLFPGGVLPTSLSQIGSRHVNTLQQAPPPSNSTTTCGGNAHGQKAQKEPGSRTKCTRVSWPISKNATAGPTKVWNDLLNQVLLIEFQPCLDMQVCLRQV